jgi:hypothetical protein
MVKLADPPFRLAVIAPVWFPDSTPLLTLKVAEAELAATLTDPGTVSALFVLVMVTLALAPVACESVVVQVVFLLAARVAAAHCREEPVGGVTRLIVAV